MRIIPTTTTVAVLVRPNRAQSPGVLFAKVTRSPLGNSVQRLGIVHDLDAATPADISAAARGASGRLTVVLPAPDCFAKPIAMSAQTFARARGEVAQTIDELFPIAQDDALVGGIDRAPAATPDASGTDAPVESGYLLAAQRSRVDAAINAVRAASGLQTHRVLTPHQAALGLAPLRHAGDNPATVAETDPAGNAVHHTFRGPPADRLAAPAPPSVVADAHLPAALDAEGARHAFDLAVAAAIIDDTAPGAVAPMLGPVTSRAAHWAAPLAFAAGAAALLIAAGFASDLRFTSAAEREYDRAASLQTEFDAATADRARLDALAANVDRARELGFPRIGRTLADIYSATTVLPEDAYYTRIELTPARALLDGVAASSGEVLRSLEISEAFANATRERGATRVSNQPPRETFSLSATRLFDERQEANQ